MPSGFDNACDLEALIQDDSSEKNLGRSAFQNDIEVQQTVLTWLHKLDPDFYDGGFDDVVYETDAEMFENLIVELMLPLRTEKVTLRVLGV
ncbi:hypothetical protein TNCV_4299691 [Trichonephila clavipes]|nr:hypothetical protein TNCV_4299691 [Trichonephila clavipes]